MQPSHRGRFEATVAFNRQICREHYLLRLRISNGFRPTTPGQFVQLGCRPPNTAGHTAWLDHQHTWQLGQPVKLKQPELCGPMALLRKPFSIAGRGNDSQGAWIDIIHREVGVGTAWLARLQSEDPVDLIGPLGNSFILPKDKSIGLLVGGGVGLPPMIYLAQALCQAAWQGVALVGAVSGDLLAVTLVEGTKPERDGRATSCVEEFAQYGLSTAITTDDGSVGLPGRITRALSPILKNQSPAQGAQTVIYTCGPNPMMHEVAKLAERYAIDCQVCMEQSMACGMGTCQSCVVKIEDNQNPHARSASGRPWRYKLACTDGPIFSARDVLWRD